MPTFQIEWSLYVVLAIQQHRPVRIELNGRGYFEMIVIPPEKTISI